MRILNIFTPKKFLQVGGAILLVVGVLGFIGVIGPSADKSIFGAFWWFDNAENIAHTILGIAGLVASAILPASLQRSLVIVLGIVGVIVGVYNFGGSQLLGANLESPADLILHLVVGAWALFAAFSKSGKAASTESK
ncbi:MAG: hypothetical protein AAB600_04995 [Patescibacteria group bacterium]